MTIPATISRTTAGDLDASALMMPIVGFLPATDPRVRSTIDAIAERLTDEHGLVYRYCASDGLAGEEGTFLLCTFWLAQARALAGEIEQAGATFEQAIAYANDVGLLAEEVDPVSNELLGNFPQAFSSAGYKTALAEATRPRSVSIIPVQVCQRTRHVVMLSPVMSNCQLWLTRCR